MIKNRFTHRITLFFLVFIGVAQYVIAGAANFVIPKAPSNLTATVVSGTQVNLAWTDTAADETGFELEQSLDGVTFVLLAALPVNTIAFQNTGLTPVTKYWYRILAKNATGKSAYSNIVTVTTPQLIPAAPEALMAISISPSQVNLAWADKSNNETGFQLERSLDGASFIKIADLGANIIAYQNTGLAMGTPYYYRVRAVNTVGASAYSNVGSAKTQNIPVPDMPQNLTAVPVAPELIQLRWSAVTGNATETVIERSKDSDDAFVQIGKVPAATLQFEDQGKLETATYYYRIKATNAGGSSPYSLVSIVLPSSIITGVESPQVHKLFVANDKILVLEWNDQLHADLSVFSVSGVRLTRSTVSGTSRTDLSALPAGIYIVVVQTNKEVISRRILLY